MVQWWIGFSEVWGVTICCCYITAGFLSAGISNEGSAFFFFAYPNRRIGRCFSDEVLSETDMLPCSTSCQDMINIHPGTPWPAALSLGSEFDCFSPWVWSLLKRQRTAAKTRDVGLHRGRRVALEVQVPRWFVRALQRGGWLLSHEDLTSYAIEYSTWIQ